MLYELKFINALIITLSVEVPILVLILKYFFNLNKLNITYKRIIFVGIIATALTLPYLWFVWIAFLPLNYFKIIGEIFVILTEALIYNQLLNLKLDKAFYVSLICNLVSIFIGFLF